MRTRLMIAALAAAVAAPAMAQTSDWRTVGEFGEGASESLMMVDAASLRLAGGNREITVTSYFAAAKTLAAGQIFDAVHISYRFDCAAATYQTFKSVAYEGEKPILTSDTLKAMGPYPAGTIIAAIAPAVCAGDFSKFAKITAATPNLEGKKAFSR